MGDPSPWWEQPRTHKEERPTNEIPIRPIELTTLLNRAYHQGLDALRRLFEEMEEVLLGDLLRHELPDGRPRYVRHGRRPRTLVTRLGRVDLEVQRVRDRQGRRTFAPLLVALGIGKRRYTPELRLAAAELATRTSYGEASEALERSLGLRIPRRTIWDFLQEITVGVERLLRFFRPSTPLERSIHEADSTFVKSQARPGAQHAVHVAVTVDPDHHVRLAEVKVGGPPTSVLERETVQHLVTDDDTGLMAYPVPTHQLCHVHFVRRLGDLLQEEGVGLLEREEVLGAVRGILAHLRNSVEYHRLRHEPWAITERVRSTLSELEQIAHRLDHGACPHAARSIRREAKALVVFAEVAMRGVGLPATSNGVERVMGMIADRCKRKWARWGRGLRNQLVMLLGRKTRRGVYELAVRRYIKGEAFP